MKTIYDDGAGKQIFDCGITDYWGNKCYATMFLDKFSGCIAKNKNYKKEKKQLESIGANFVIPQSWLEVINFKPEMINKMKKYFNIPDFYISNKWEICD